MKIDDEVQVKIAGLSRPLYGVIRGLIGTRVKVHVFSSHGQKVIEVDKDTVSPWRTRG